MHLVGQIARSARSVSGAHFISYRQHSAASTVDLSGLLGSVPDISNRHLLTLRDFSEDEVHGILDVSIALKKWFKSPHTEQDAHRLLPLVGRSVALIFQKRSTRTRLSMETGIGKLGGRPIFLGSDDIQLGVNESLSVRLFIISPHVLFV